jgi:hypothetical protein
MNELQAFLDSQAGLALKGALVAAFLDFATGSFAAIRDGTFALDAIAAFLRKHILGRVAPLAALLAGAYLSGDQLLSGFAIAGLATYAAETLSSVKGNILPPAPSNEPVSAEKALAEELNPPPVD